MAKINFPKPAIDGQIYPNLDSGDLPLENNDIYMYDGVLGVWKILCDDERDFYGVDPIIIDDEPYEDHIKSISFDPNPLPKITTP